MIGEFQKSLIKLWEEPRQVKPEKLSFKKNTQPPVKQMTNLQQNKQQNNLQNQQNNLHFNVPSSSNNVLQPNNRQNLKNEPDQKLNILQMHQNCQKPNLQRDFEGKGACRQIFDDDE